MIEINISLENLIRSDLGEPKRVGRRLYWRCPFHDDHNPSLTIKKDSKHWKCYGCGKSGDAIQWVMERRGISFKEAVTSLNGRWSDFSFPEPRKPSSRPNPKKASPSPEEWTRNATAVAAECAERLATTSGDKARQWLNARGLNNDTISRWKLGYNPHNRSVRGLYLKRGITIPWVDSGSVRCIKVRQPISTPKYVWVGGGQRSGLYLAEEIRPGVPALVVEGEFDALLAWQEIRNQVDVVTLGSADDPPDHHSLQQILTAPLILLCYDNDPAGKDGAKRWRLETSRTRIATVPSGKDLTDFYLAGGDLRNWISRILRANPINPTRHLTVAFNPMDDTAVGVGLPARHVPDTSDSYSTPPQCSGFKEKVTC